jgi:hypothetical protein
VVQLHDLARDMGLQCAIVVGQIGQYVGSHSSPFASDGIRSQTDAHATTRD